MYISDYSCKSDLATYLIKCPWTYFREKDYCSLLSFTRKQLLQICLNTYLMYFSLYCVHLKIYDEFFYNHQVNINERYYNGIMQA